MADGGVHLLFVDVLYLGGRAAQDSFLLLFGQRLCHHLDGFHPLVPATRHSNRGCFRGAPGVGEREKRRGNNGEEGRGNRTGKERRPREEKAKEESEEVLEEQPDLSSGVSTWKVLSMTVVH